ncbi:hypothetical protein ACFQQB_11445 [Nonomuraea rubra]|uniref:hypothetical protein n=1 Tax=Nonomuraea rubra TaxID=46180 RepID=UPI00360F0EAC
MATDSHIGVQAGTVHNLNVYERDPRDSPETTFRKGVSFLKGRMPGPARRLINDAMVGYTTNEVYFYWLLAMVSRRTRHELTKDETGQLRDRHATMQLRGEDPWREECASSTASWSRRARRRTTSASWSRTSTRSANRNAA